MSLSVGGKGQDAPLMVPLERMSYGFPTEFKNKPSTSAVAHRNSADQLSEFVISSESGDCPDISLRHAYCSQ